jgi:hypothetical protein
MSGGRTAAEGHRQQATDTLRVLVIANETVAGNALLDEIGRRARQRPTEVLVVAPALIESRLKHAVGDVDEAAEQAHERLTRSLDRIKTAGVEAEGRVGDADPNLAIADALRTFPADEVIISTHPRERSAWLEKDVVERARREIEQPITHVVVDLEADSERERAREVERIPARRWRRAGRDDELDYLPPMPARDRLTLIVGITGTIVLGILAITCPDGGSISGGCAARILIAIGAFMVTLWHSIALLLMGSVRYRGFWADLAAKTVLFGIPAAVLVSLLLD